VEVAVEIEQTIEIKVVCENCGSDLEASYSTWDNTLTVEPCSNCDFECEMCGAKLHKHWSGGSVSIEPCSQCIQQARDEVREEIEYERELVRAVRDGDQDAR
jgi:hypothetical protein